MFPAVIKCLISSFMDFHEFAHLRSVSKSWHIATKSSTALPYIEFWPAHYLEHNPTTESLDIRAARTFDCPRLKRVRIHNLGSQTISMLIQHLPKSVISLTTDEGISDVNLMTALEQSKLDLQNLEIIRYFHSSELPKFEFLPGMKHVYKPGTTYFSRFNNPNYAKLHTLIMPVTPYFISKYETPISNMPDVRLSMSTYCAPEFIHKKIVRLSASNADLSSVMKLSMLQNLNIGDIWEATIHCAEVRFTPWPLLNYIGVNKHWLFKLLPIISSGVLKNNCPRSSPIRCYKSYLIIIDGNFYDNVLSYIQKHNLENVFDVVCKK